MALNEPNLEDQQSEPRQVQALVKFFSEEDHADQFVKGNLYMRKLRYFQKLEASEVDDGRPDPHEAITAWHQPDRVELTISFPGLEPIKIGPGDLAGPVAISRNFYSDMHLFCMSALSIPDPASLEGDQEAVQAQLQSAIQVDDRCLEFGPHAVIVSAQKFMPHLRQALEKSGLWHRAALVEYYNESTFHGEFSKYDVPFRKQSRFDYQKEYRVCVQNNNISDEPMILNISNISDFAIKCPSKDLNKYMKITVKDKET